VGDRALVWQWANDPAVRAASFSSAPIAWDDHVRWFDERLSDTESAIYIASDGGGAEIGYARFRHRGSRCEISVALGADARGRGYGAAIIRAATACRFRDTDATAVDAWVKPGNPASIRAFTSAGFERIEDGHVEGRPALHLVLERERAPA
jgi:RimJ/RimL family protein N-acetyltransferase